MLRAAVAAGTPVGLKAKAIMERGELVSDEVVVGIVADASPDDARNGFILDGFPRTVAQARRSTPCSTSKGLKLDGVIEFKVDEDALVGRIEKRAAETLAGGEPVRKDDNPEAFKPGSAPIACRPRPCRPITAQGDLKTRRRHAADRRRDARDLLRAWQSRGLIGQRSAREDRRAAVSAWQVLSRVGLAWQEIVPGAINLPHGAAVVARRIGATAAMSSDDRDDEGTPRKGRPRARRPRADVELAAPASGASRPTASVCVPVELSDKPAFLGDPNLPVEFGITWPASKPSKGTG